MYYPTDPIKNVTGVGEYLEKKFKAAEIKTIADLLNYFPFRYEDLSKIKTVADILPNEPIVLKGQFKQITTFYTRSKKQITKAKFFDNSGVTEVMWFNSPFIKQQLNDEDIFMITAKPSLYNGKVNIVNPVVEKSGKVSVKSGRVVPVYFNIPGIHMTKLKKILLDITENTEITDFISFDKGKSKGLPSQEGQVESDSTKPLKQDRPFLELGDAYKNLHFPSSLKMVQQAQDRIALNEIIHIKLHSEKVKAIQKKTGAKFKLKKDVTKNFLPEIPFKLTKDQLLAVDKITKGLKSNKPLNALVSGDVGSGKTIVAITTSKNVVENGGKIIYLAPTVVLAKQVYNEYLNYFDKKDLILVTAKSSKNVDLKNVKIVIGTHAVLNIEAIEKFADLVVIDEQHKFGVKQRAKIIENTKTLPHVLTMTATPIPRSLALTFFGEMELIQIKSKPVGRIPVITKVLSENKRKDCYDWIKKEVINKNSVYYIVPFINKSESEDFANVKSIEEVEKQLIKTFGRKNITTLHGKFKEYAKQKTIEDFKKKSGGIILSTQVVEVGVDIKDATVIIIESAERFGLASLHQLRGRVGRNNLQSYCFLFTSTKSAQNSLRLKNLEKETDGFKLANLDLKTRGSGEVFGIRQSGEIDLKFVDFTNTKLIEKASKIAKEIYSNRELLESYTKNPLTREFLNIKDN